MLNHKKQVENFMLLSQKYWSEYDKIDFLNYCMGVLKNKIDKIDLQLMLNQFSYYEKKACQGLDKAKI